VDGLWATNSEGVGLIDVHLVSKISNLCDPDPPTLQTDGQTDRRTTCYLNTALCTSASRGKKIYDPARRSFHYVAQLAGMRD